MAQTLVVTFILLLAPVVVAAADPCATLPGGTCAGVVPVVLGTDIGSGQTATFDAPAYIIAGLVVVHDGGTMLVQGTTLDFDSEDAGILVESGGTLRILDNSILQSTTASITSTAPFRVVAEAGSVLEMDAATIIGGTFVVSDATAALTRNKFESTPLALELHGVVSTLADNNFANAAAGIQILGGSPTVRGSVFDEVDTCITVANADFTLEQSTLNHCFDGVIATESNTLIANSLLLDRQDPGSVGTAILNGNAHIHETQIEDWGVGIRVSNGGTLHEHENTYSGNLVDIEFV